MFLRNTVLASFFTILMFVVKAQTGLNFQGVARSSNNVILASQPISLRLSILQGSATGNVEYSEIKKITTNAQGLFTTVIGDADALSVIGNFNSINWKNTPKFLKIEIDPKAGNDFITMGATQFQYVAYAQFAKRVDAENIVGIIPVTLGGTGVSSLTNLKSELAVEKINNTADTDKPISKLTQSVLDLKLNKADTSSLSNRIDLKANVANVTASLVLKAPLANPIFTGTVAGITKTMVGLENVDNTSDASKPISTSTQAALDLKLNTIGNAATATKLATARNINGVAFDGSTDITISAAAEQLTGTVIKSMVTGSSLTSVGTLTNLTVTNPIVGSVTGNAATATNLTGLTTSVATLNNLSGVNTGDQTAITGNAGTATKLATARNINGVAFDGSADISISAAAAAEQLIGTTIKSTVTGSSLTSVGTLVNLTVTNPIVGSITGNSATATNLTGLTTSVATLNNLSGVNTGDQTTITGNAGTATKLATARNINGVAFDGSADITLTADAGTLTGTTLKSTVTGSSLTSVGTLNNATVNGKVIVGNESATSTSAVLEVNSTTQGFLPPRMTYYQRTQIASPIAGLVIWCKNCGAVGQLQVYSENGTWTNLVGTAAEGVYTPPIGQSYQGGIVAYILKLGDYGYDPITPHGLIAATADQSTGIKWRNINYTNTYSTAYVLGAGFPNTNRIITIQGETATNYAAGIARAYTGGGYTDWFLPSKNELNEMYLNIGKGASGPNTNIGGFADTYYWSSSEVSGSSASSEAYSQSFQNGTQDPNNKIITNYVRAVRAF